MRTLQIRYHLVAEGVTGVLEYGSEILNFVCQNHASRRQTPVDHPINFCIEMAYFQLLYRSLLVF